MLCPLMCKLMSEHEHGDGAVRSGAAAAVGEVIDQREDAEAPAADQRVSHEVERPAQIAVLRDRHGCPRAQGSLATATLAHRQPFFPVEPIKLLRAQLDALALQHEAEPPIAKPPPLRCQFAQAPAQLVIARPLCRIAIRLRVQADQATSTALRVALLSDRPGHSSSPQAGRQKFFPSISLSVDASSIVSARSFFSFRFSSSMALSLRASETSIPP